MQFCNFCAKTMEQVKDIRESDVINCDNEIQIISLLHIFQDNIVKFFLDHKNTVICNICLKRLKDCYEFVEQMKNSEIRLNLGKKIETEHDYFGSTEKNATSGTLQEVTVNCATSNTHVKPFSPVKSHPNFTPILPKMPSAETDNKKFKKILHHKPRLYKCLQCIESFKSYKNLKEHEKHFCKNKSVKYLKVCKFCHTCYSNENSLSAHISLRHPQGEFLCCLCQNKTFTAKGFLSRHIQKVHQHESLNFFCGECLVFQCLPSQEEVREHFLDKHHPEIGKTSSENLTKMTLNDEDMDLEMHVEFLDEFLLAHTNENSFQFSDCWEALDLHLPDMLQANAANLNNVQGFTDAFYCPKCYEQFRNPQPLLEHLASIHDLPVLVCRVCCKCFASFNDFKRHKLQKCFKNVSPCDIKLDCPYCSKMFKSSSNLKQHLRIVHTQLKKHICQLCDKQFSTLDHLKKHVLSQHQNERKHECTICKKSFTQLGHLKQHLAIHTTGKTVNCSNCPLKFWRKIDLERHRQKHHPNCTQK